MDAQWVNGPYYFIKIGQNSLQTCKRTGGAGEFIAPELEQLAGLLAAVTVSGDGVVSRCRDSMKGISCWLVSHNSPRKSNFSFIISSTIRNGSILLTKNTDDHIFNKMYQNELKYIRFLPSPRISRGIIVSPAEGALSANALMSVNSSSVK